MNSFDYLCRNFLWEMISKNKKLMLALKIISVNA